MEQLAVSLAMRGVTVVRVDRKNGPSGEIAEFFRNIDMSDVDCVYHPGRPNLGI